MRKWIIAALFVFIITIISLGLPEPTAAPASMLPTPEALAAASPMPTSTPTPAATPTPEIWTFPKGTIIAGKDVGGLTPEHAIRRVESAIAPFLLPLRVVAGEETTILYPEELGIRLSAADIVAQAQDAIKRSAADRPYHFPIQLSLDRETIADVVVRLAAEVRRPPLLTIDPQHQTFVITPGVELDIDASIERLIGRLQSPDANRRVTLPTRIVEDTLPPSEEQILTALQPLIESFDGVIGIYASDLKGNRLFSYNANTIFSGASTMKIAILLQSYLSLERFTRQQITWMEEMIVNSDNKLSNNLLVAIGKAEHGSANPLLGLRAMHETLRRLGLTHTYMLAPYESVGSSIDPDSLDIPENKGEPPYTKPDPYLQTTPAEMARLVLQIGQCANGHGLLLEYYSQMTAERCEEILALMERAGDRSKIVAGVPEGVRVAHKSGWIDDTRADVGIVGSGDEALIFAIWIWSDEYDEYIPESISDPLIASIARTLYSAFHPTMIAGTEGNGP
ncbi:MAG: hypothetical protein KatS3mg057_2739 [Herpetosiphonaceae bacterium]|nr:MAG: hypothetical protein KatS3mg057_2739 [Herpetosiphonaceae bacterium]